MKTFKEIYKQLITEGKISTNYKSVSQYKTDKNTSKMWITPKGEVINLSIWHHDWILQNAKKLKIKIKRKGEDVRLDGLDAGYFRVNYSHASGDLVVEGKQKLFTSNIKDAVFGLVHKNIDNIWNISIILFDDNYTIVNRGDAALFTFDGNEKLEHIPLISESIKRLYDKKYSKERRLIENAIIKSNEKNQNV